MGKKFNISGTCLSDRHYMVDLNSSLKKIGSMVENGDYFEVNRAHQYGKTTTLWSLRSAEKLSLRQLCNRCTSIAASGSKNEGEKTCAR